MAYPTFAAFVVPYDGIGSAQMSQWMDTFAGICDFTGVDLNDFALGTKPVGDICLTSYFEASQAVIATMVMSNRMPSLANRLQEDYHEDDVVMMAEIGRGVQQGNLVAVAALTLLLAVLGMFGLTWACLHHHAFIAMEVDNASVLLPLSDEGLCDRVE